MGCIRVDDGSASSHEIQQQELWAQAWHRLHKMCWKITSANFNLPGLHSGASEMYESNWKDWLFFSLVAMILMPHVYTYVYTSFKQCKAIWNVRMWFYSCAKKIVTWSLISNPFCCSRPSFICSFLAPLSGNLSSNQWKQRGRLEAVACLCSSAL